MSDDLRSAFARAADLLPDAPDRVEQVMVRRRRRQRRRASAAGVASALLVMGGAMAIASTSGSRPPAAVLSVATPSPPTVVRSARVFPSPATRKDPLSLVGRWQLSATGLPKGTSLILGDDLVLFLPCGVVDGSWRAVAPEGLFVGLLIGADQGSQEATDQPWLAAARGFRVDGLNRALLDAQGNVVATLRPGATPTVGPNRSRSFAAVPAVNAREVRDAKDAAPLPPGVVPPTAEQLQRRWVPSIDHSAGKAYVSFDADGTWRGSDGCNGSGAPMPQAPVDACSPPPAPPPWLRAAGRWPIPG